MNCIRTLVAAVVAGGLASGCGKADTAQKTQSTALPEIPMPSPMQIPIALVSNYGFMDVMFSKGDGRSYSGYFADTATMHRVGIGPLNGRDNIANLVRGADAYATAGFARISEGFSVSGREVTDSGRYVVASGIPFPPTDLIQRGRYKTRWTFTPNGEWLILSDSLIGEQQAR